MKPSPFTRSGDVVFWRTARLTPEAVEQLMALFQRERAWDLFDALQFARDGAVEPQMEAA